MWNLCCLNCGLLSSSPPLVLVHWYMMWYITATNSWYVELCETESDLILPLLFFYFILFYCGSLPFALVACGVSKMAHICASLCMCWWNINSPLSTLLWSSSTAQSSHTLPLNDVSVAEIETAKYKLGYYGSTKTFIKICCTVEDETSDFQPFWWANPHKTVASCWILLPMMSVSCHNRLFLCKTSQI